ncbi:hypothetical protein F5Y11DRAFT_98616 [Daldinia sp. FL1419]|nr:hypothetical protein F5Y11DRAFT_98616 [Daldinia sp. FL1419]
MERIPYEIIAASKPFRFLVGTEKKEFFMHSELVARISKPLRTLVEGEWKEGKEKSAEWSDVDEGTFVRFCEFAYSGDYMAAEPFDDTATPLKDQGGVRVTPFEPQLEGLDGSTRIFSIPQPQPVFPSDPWDAAASDYAAKKKKKAYKGWDSSPPTASLTKKDVMWREFQEGVNDEPDRGLKETENTSPSKNYSEVLLSHARLYAFADCYDIQPLLELSLRKLHRTLNVFNLHKGARVVDVAQLIDYSYKNTANKGGNQDKLRSMLATYMACKIEDMWSNLYFQDILESPDVSKAIIGQLLKRVS